ncbi:MAG TPA: cytochrome c oxidase subunit II [Polyangiaceae bacterium]|nr:cytochrome c oxidase subunit II [Polyangiaceae bacterium]
MARTPARNAVGGLLAVLLCGCGGAQSALAPAGPTAARLATLFWGLTLGALFIWLLVVALALYAAYFPHRGKQRTRARRLIVGGGVVFPSVVLTGVLSYSLALLPELLAPAPEGSLRVEVIGYQWWWEVRYLRAGQQPVVLANEVRVPLGQPVEFELESRDVIHSFWIPALGGKMDMIPGRRTRLRLQADRAGVFRGACAEYCGTSHALMAFPVVALEPSEFAAWLRAQSANAHTPSAPNIERGGRLFLENGCGACHSVRGSEAAGRVGPDLSHVGGRLSLAAGTLSNGRSELARWLVETERLKPGVHMPSFGMLPASDIEALAAYLESLK